MSDYNIDNVSLINSRARIRIFFCRNIQWIKSRFLSSAYIMYIEYHADYSISDCLSNLKWVQNSMFQAVSKSLSLSQPRLDTRLYIGLAVRACGQLFSAWLNIFIRNATRDVRSKTNNFREHAIIAAAPSGAKSISPNYIRIRMLACVYRETRKQYRNGKTSLSIDINYLYRSFAPPTRPQEKEKRKRYGTVASCNCYDPTFLATF